MNGRVEKYVWLKLIVKAKHRGSISAEHGLGLAKNEYLHCSKALPVIDVMRSVKQALDPNGIMNPYKYFPSK